MPATQWENVFGTISALNFERIIFHGDHRNRFTFFKTMSATMKMDGHAGTVLPRIPLLRFRPRQRIKNLKFLFFTEPDGQMISIPPGLFPSPLQFHSTSARPAARIYFPPTLSNMISPPSREVHRRPQDFSDGCPSVPTARTLPRCVSAPPVPRPCDNPLCVAAGWPSTGRT